MYKLEKGQCFFISKNEVMVENNTVFVEANDVLFKVGTIPKEEVSWFGSQLNEDVVVYIGDDNYSFKKFTTPLEEFETLKKHPLGDMRDYNLTALINELEELRKENKILLGRISELSC